MTTGRKRRIQKEVKQRLNTFIRLKACSFCNSVPPQFPQACFYKLGTATSPSETQEHLLVVQKYTYFSNKYVFSLHSVFVK